MNGGTDAASEDRPMTLATARIYLATFIAHLADSADAKHSADRAISQAMSAYFEREVRLLITNPREVLLRICDGAYTAEEIASADEYEIVPLIAVYMSGQVRAMAMARTRVTRRAKETYQPRRVNNLRGQELASAQASAGKARAASIRANADRDEKRERAQVEAARNAARAAI
jgi:hypothetical protein